MVSKEIQYYRAAANSTRVFITGRKGKLIKYRYVWSVDTYTCGKDTFFELFKPC